MIKIAEYTTEAQYSLHHVISEMDQVPSAGEVRTFLTPRPSMAEGTEQDTIADTIEPTVPETERYLTETESPDYEEREQTTLDTRVSVQGEQAEITKYN